MRFLKIISIISFLLINGLDENRTLNLGLILVFLFEFIRGITHFWENDIFWEGIITIPLIGTLIVFSQCKNRKDSYLYLICFISLLLSALVLTEVIYPKNYEKVSYGYVVSLLIFMCSSLLIFFKLLRKN